MKCYGTCLFLKGLWMDMTGQILPIHIRTDANNLVTTATKTTLPEQKDTIHMITSLRTEACSGQIDDLAHVTTDVQMADCLTKDKPTLLKGLQNTVNTGVIPKVDMHMPFREMMMTKHKAYLAHWLSRNIRTTEELPGGIHSVSYFLMEPVREALHTVLYGRETGLPVRSGINYFCWPASWKKQKTN